MGGWHYELAKVSLPQVIEHVQQKKPVTLERVIQFLQKVRNAHPDAKIVVVLDNARYNYTKDTRAFAEENNILLLFLPPYAPNLNLIERLWKFAKKHLVRYFLQQF